MAQRLAKLLSVVPVFADTLEEFAHYNPEIDCTEIQNVASQLKTLNEALTPECRELLCAAEDLCDFGEGFVVPESGDRLPAKQLYELKYSRLLAALKNVEKLSVRVFSRKRDDFVARTGRIDLL